VVWRQVEQEAVVIFAHGLYLKPKYLPRGASEEDLNSATESTMRLPIAVLSSNYGTVLLRLRDMTTGRTTDDGPTTATIAYLVLGGLAIILLKGWDEMVAWFISQFIFDCHSESIISRSNSSQRCCRNKSGTYGLECGVFVTINVYSRSFETAERERRIDNIWSIHPWHDWRCGGIFLNGMRRQAVSVRQMSVWY